MSHFTAKQIEEAVTGCWNRLPGDMTGVSTDTRTIQIGDLFVALSGDSFDGHDYVEQAASNGAVAAIVGREVDATIPLYRVEDTLTALQQLAAYHREILRAGGAGGTKVIAVTGSNGKTTTRHLIATVLSAKLRGTQSPKSFNNHIGVPLTLLAASTQDDFVVAEVGTNHPGEIEPLARLLLPDVAVITNIGAAHIGHFGSREAIAQEKGALLSYVAADGLVIVPHDEPLLDAAIEQIAGEMQICCIGNDVQVTGGNENGLTVNANGEHMDMTLPLPGEHNVTNALAAVAVGQWFGMDVESIAAALAGAAPVDMRAQTVRRGDVTFINDAYNANPDSMRAALTMLAAADAPARRVAVLGDMFELGDFAMDAHRAVGEQIAAMDERIDLVVLIGKLSTHAAVALPAERCCVFEQWDDALPARVRELLQPNDLVLVKASRGMALERLIPDA